MSKSLEGYKPTTASKGIANDAINGNVLAEALADHLADCGVAKAVIPVKLGNKTYRVTFELISVESKESLN